MLDSKLEQARKKVILALDVQTFEEAERLIKLLLPYVGMFKVGLEFMTAQGGPQIVKFIHSLGGQVFYDGKFSDIPNTIQGAAKAVAKLGVKIFNAKADSGIEAMRAAVANKGRSKVYFVSVLTSVDEVNSELIFGASAKAKVLQFARDIVLAGGDGIICSPQELEMLGKYPELKRLKKMTPGIRPAFSQTGDQKRVMTPAEAIKAKADYLVIGRPITKPDMPGMTPDQAALKILEEIAEALVDEDNAVEKKIDAILAEVEAIVTNSHFVYAAWEHGSAYVNKDAINPHTEKINELCGFMSEMVEDEDIDFVYGGATAGVIPTHYVAQHLSRMFGRQIHAVFADQIKENGETEFVIKRGQEKFIKGRRGLGVEDIFTTGTNIKKATNAVKAAGGIVVGIVGLCNRNHIEVTAESLGVPKLEVLKNVVLEKYKEAGCPLCKAGIPINTKLGKGAEYLKKKAEKV